MDTPRAANPDAHNPSQASGLINNACTNREVGVSVSSTARCATQRHIMSSAASESVSTADSATTLPGHPALLGDPLRWNAMETLWIRAESSLAGDWEGG
jgi:hypothetical protein